MIITTGMPHSGTTILNLLFGAHPEHIAVGEAFDFIKDEERARKARDEGKLCSCGVPAPECEFWGPFLERALGEPQGTHVERYLAFLRHARQWGTPVDSSKSIIRSRHLDKFDAKVLFVVKDVRSWAVAARTRASKRGLKTKTMPHLFMRWHRHVRKMLRALDGEDHLVLGYDRLALDPATVLAETCESIGIPFSESMLEPHLGSAHLLLGNGPLLYFKRASVQYDDRWMRQNGWVLTAALMPWVMRENARLVYGV